MAEHFDLFISYAHVDNEPMIEGGSRWVSALKKLLDRVISKKLGRSDSCRIWFDESDLRGNHELRSHIPDSVRHSTLFLPIVSPGYVTSEWCLSELAAFAERHPDERKERIFPIHRAPLRPDQKMPELVDGLRNYRFWFTDDRDRRLTFAEPAPRVEQTGYWEVIDDVAEDIANRLAAVSSAAPARSAAASVPQRFAAAEIVLAEVQDDVRPRRDEVRRFLDQYGVKVLPEGAYPTSFAEFEKAISSDLRGAACFVQMLGEVPDEHKAFAQYQAAVRLDTPILQWRSPDLKIETVKSLIWRNLLSLDTVQAIGIEDFKQAVLTRLELRMTPTPPAAPAPLLLINADRVDLDEAHRLQDELGDQIYSEVWSPDPAKGAESIETEIKEKTVGCDAVVVFYGAAEPDWVGRQILQVRKHRSTPLRLSWIVTSPPPPPEKPRLNVRSGAWETRSIREAAQELRQALR